MNNIKDYLTKDITLVVYNNGQIITSLKRGITPILDLLEDSACPLQGALLADRVTGKASAMLLAKGKVKSLHSEVLSSRAIPILNQYHIEFTYDVLCDMIENRSKTGMCPMEETVMNIDDIEEAYVALKKKVSELSGY